MGVSYFLLHVQAYQGHVFWDQDTWMYPSILMLYPDLGRNIVNTRSRTRHAAAANAILNHVQGLQYPWESAFTGKFTVYKS